MLVEARLRLVHPEPYAGRLPPGVQLVQVSGDFGRGLCTLTGAPGSDLDAALRAVATWLDEPPELVDRGARSLVLRYSAARRGLASHFACWGANVLWPAVHEEATEWWHVAAPSGDAMASILRRLEALGDVRVEKLGRPTADEVGVSLPLGELTQLLSARQLAALKLAVERGYYASPRRATLAQLAHECAVSRSTFQEHLQKAETRVMERFGGVLAAHPALAAAATRTAGRPRAPQARRREMAGQHRA